MILSNEFSKMQKNTDDETLLDKARQNMDVANMIYSCSKGDEIYLNYIGYHLQQAVELAIKHGMECFGVEYPKTHDISQLIRKCNEENVPIGVTEYADDHSEMFTEWEAKTRYIKNYKLEARKIERALKEVPKLILSIEKEAEQVFENDYEHELS